jgi:1,4-dihydroxy-2-naphthoate octaprenyltransferase
MSRCVAGIANTAQGGHVSTAKTVPAPGIAARAKGLAAIARIPFLSVGILPYVLGARIALWAGVPQSAPVFWLGLAAVVLIMLATYFNGEYADVLEDRVSTELGRNPFAGGSRGVVDGLVTREQARIGGYVVTGAAVVIGLVLAFVCGTGVWTLPIGIFGLASGYFYSMPPLRWVERGIGELLIGICYGWLPVAIGYYLQAGELPPILLWASLPVAFTIFNVIFVNEYPDFEGDAAVGKRNLLQRVGRERGTWIYRAAVVASPLAFAYSLTKGVPNALWPWYAVVVVLSLVPTAMLGVGLWRSRKYLVPICGMTIVVNLATTSVLIASFWPRG